MAKIKITQVRSLIREQKPHRATVEALGLGRIRKSVEVEDTPGIRGMIFKVKHLVSVEAVQE